VRGELTSGLIDSIVSEVDSTEPDAGEVADHYAENIDFFTRPGRLRARTIFFSARGDESDPRGPAQNRATQARQRLLTGESADDVERALGDSQVSPIPDVLLPASKVRDYVGPTVLETLAGLETLSWSQPITSGSGYSLAIVLERDAPIVPPLDEIESLVRQDLKRRRGDEALRDYLTALRAETPVAIDETLFDVARETP
jgi:hypothetical protein